MAVFPKQDYNQPKTSPAALAVIKTLQHLDSFFTNISEPPTTTQLQQFYKLMAQLNSDFAQGKFSPKINRDAIAFQNTVMQYMSNPNPAALIFLDNEIHLFMTDLMSC
ncbi:MAG: hypothetical protein HY860_00115 [Chlamydiales bacterium]|nr:hypothetical protein [Chlamydiales bacterium]